MNGNQKGSSFEREICKQLSAWWKPGRDDIFWRSSQSGGRATQRAKAGKGTYGSYGDIAAVDPIGSPLLEMFTIELKRGKSHGSPGDVIDMVEDTKSNPFTKTIRQVMRSAEQAGSLSWLIISKRDHKECMVYGDAPFLREFMHVPIRIRFYMRIVDEICPILLGGVTFKRFLQVNPKEIIQSLKNKL